MTTLDYTHEQLLDELQELTLRLREAEEKLRAIRSGEVDALIVETAQGDRVFTLSGADLPYRVMVETMHEGAVTLSSDGTILFCNQCFADIVKKSLETVLGSSIYEYVSSTDLALFNSLLEQGLTGNRKLELSLQTNGGSSAVVLLSLNPLKHASVPDGICMVVTDLKEQKFYEKILVEHKLTSQILHQASEILLICDHNGRIIQASDPTNRILGGSPVFQAFDEAFHLLYPDGSPFLLLPAMGGMSLDGLEVLFKQREKKFLTFLLNATILTAPEDTDGIMVIMVNITKRKEFEGVLKQVNEELEQRVEKRTVELRTALSEIQEMKEQLEAENIYFREEVKTRLSPDNIIGESDGLKYVLYRAEQVAPLDTTVLILGETGTGKDLIAAAIHEMGPRKKRPLIKVNCASLPGNLIESELFGREKGAFTGADTRQIGRFEIANDSTLCLDEIGELPLELQAKLLQVIQDKKFERLGSSQAIKVDVRIIATTNRDLEEEIRKGRFRKDLYYRLNVFPLTIPPLRKRKDDIPLMVRAFIARYSKKTGKQITSIPRETMKVLQDYSWPGNVRELESVLERAMILSPGTTLRLAENLGISSPLHSSSVKTLEDTERNKILEILSETRWRIEGKDGAATILGLHPSTLRARMHKLGIVRPETKEPG